MSSSIFDRVYPDAVETIVARLAADEDVQQLARPSDVATTRGDYGRYLHVLPRLAEDSPLATSRKANLRVWAVILVRAGGDRQGISDALRIVGG